jgi:ferredoxin-NADP reductase
MTLWIGEHNAVRIPALDYEHGEGLGEYVVHRVPTVIAKNTYEVVLEKPDGMRYRPGSAMKWYERQGDGTFAKRRTFSMVSSPHEPYLVFAYRGSDSDFKSRYLASLSVGDRVHLRNPQDEMLYASGNDPLLMVAGGIGITPMISLLRYAAFIQTTRSITLLYANPSRDFEAYRDELDQYATAHPLTIIRAYADEGRVIHAGDIAPYVREVPQPYVYIAGPEGMTRTLRSAVLAAGMRESRVQVTDFSGYAGSAGFE